MRKIHITFLLILFNLVLSKAVYGQQKLFNKIDFGNNTRAGISGIAQDQQGYLWFTAENNGLMRYDGTSFITYQHSEKDTNSISGAPAETLAVDAAGTIWIGTLGGGMNKFDPATNRFTHFRHNPSDPQSLAHDTVTAILEDHLGNLWVGTYNGLDLYDRKTRTFSHYRYKANDPNSLSGTHVRALYEDKAGNLWVGCGSPWPNEESWKDEGGLNRFDRATGTFTRFLHDPNDAGSLENNKVRALLEDSKGNFWVGTAGDGLQILDRRSGKFVHYHYDVAHPEGLSRGYWDRSTVYDQVEFIKEDIKGRIWIGTYGEGLIEYDPHLRKVTHHGYTMRSGKVQADTATGFNDNQAWSSLVTKDGLPWISTLGGNLYNISQSKKVVLPFANNINGGFSFYEANGVLWVGTVNGLVRKDEQTGNEKRFTDPIDSLQGSNIIYAIVADSKGRLWLATPGGLNYFDPPTNRFIHYKYDPKNGSGLRDSIFASLFIDATDNLWFGTQNLGMYELNTRTGETRNFLYDSIHNNFFNNPPLAITGTKKDIWFATDGGVGRLEIASGEMKRYLPSSSVRSIVVDNSGVVWAGAINGLYYYNSAADKFDVFENPNVTIKNIISIIKDNRGNIWLSTTSAIFALNTKDKSVRIYGSEMGVHANTFSFTHNCISANGELFIGDRLGYYHFYTDSIKTELFPPSLNLASLQIGGREISSGAGNILNKPLYAIEELKLPNDKNSFSIGFSAIDFRTPGTKRVIYMLKNYDNQWHETNADQRAYFYNLPIGNYQLHVRVINAAGAWSEKVLSIVITPPWWQTWWALTLFAIVLIGIVLGFSYYRSYSLRKENRVLEEKVTQRTAQLQRSIEDLKATQAQLVQSEKMASLGELTAGIAHEIQNPLNFVNNFSEVSVELANELKEEIDKLTVNPEEKENLSAIADDLIQNQEKINFHGARADSIVKGMLQHARASAGQKEPIEINKLIDEYLRLSYHGLRAKDKSFNAEIKTHFDESIGQITVIPQDIGRVLLNFFNNAFYAVAEKKKKLNGTFEPMVSVVTKQENGSVRVTINDNGIGIPQKILDKIFQPFFTTKPTGQGTGLGLSLSYDIIKAHSGEIKVETKESEGTSFVIILPYKKEQV